MVERRRALRVPVAKGAAGRLKTTVPVSIHNISSAGLQIEVPTPLRPGSVYELKADFTDGLTFSGQVRVTRCAAGSFTDDGRGGRVLMYRAGAEFVQIDEALTSKIEAWTERQRTSGAGPAILQV